MRPSWRKDWRAIALALAGLLAACGGKPAVQTRVLDPTPDAFSAANLDINRPCTLLTTNDAADIAGMPFYRTMAANLVDESRVRCAQGVGEHGLHGVVEIDMHMAADGAAARDMFNRTCRLQAGAPPPAPVPVVPPEVNAEGHFGEAHIDPAVLTVAPAPSAPVPVVNGEHCALAGGAYALFLPDRVVMLRVRESAGEVDAAASLRLASLVSFRLSSN